MSRYLPASSEIQEPMKRETLHSGISVPGTTLDFYWVLGHAIRLGASLDIPGAPWVKLEALDATRLVARLAGTP